MTIRNPYILNICSHFVKFFGGNVKYKPHPKSLPASQRGTFKTLFALFYRGSLTPPHEMVRLVWKEKGLNLSFINKPFLFQLAAVSPIGGGVVFIKELFGAGEFIVIE
jgi:hypothetical protein